MPKITQVGPDVKDRFFLLVDDKPRAVFRTLEGAMEGFRTTLEILGDLPLAPSHEDISSTKLAPARSRSRKRINLEPSMDCR
jgi:hypothetical protein